MDFSFLKMFGKGWKGFAGALLAQVIAQLPELVNGIPLGDWGGMTVKGAIVAVLVMIANLIKHKLAPNNAIVERVI